MRTFGKKFSEDKFQGGFILYQKYSRKDVFRVLNWDENELLSPSNAPAVFIKEFCLVIFYGFLGVKLSSYIFDVWL